MDNLSAGQRLKELRKDAQLSIVNLSKLCGVSKSHLSRLELCQQEGTPQVWQKIEAYFGVSFGIQTPPVVEQKSVVQNAIFDEPLTVIELPKRIEIVEPKPVPVFVPKPDAVVKEKEAMTGQKLVAACYDVINKLTADGYIRKNDSRNFIPIRSRWPKYIQDLVSLVVETVATCENLPEILGAMGRAGFSILCLAEQRKAFGLHLKHHDYLPCGTYSKEEPYFLQD